MSSGARRVKGLSWLVRSSSLRLTLLLSAIFVVGMVIAIIVALAFGRQAVLQRVDASLAGLAATVAAGEAPDDGLGALIRPRNNLGALPRAFERAAARGGGTVELDDDFRNRDEWRVTVANDQAGEPVLIALPLDDAEDALELLGRILWLTAGGVLIIVFGLGLGAGLLAQRRLTSITGTLDALAGGDLSSRTGLERGSDDISDVARQVDRTAAELERLVAQTRHLSASLAHDLRTPLARLRAKLENLPEGEARGAALEEAERLTGIFDTIMRVARIEAGQGTAGFEPVDLGALATELEEIFGPVVEDSGKSLVLAGAGAGTVLADRSMLVQALANLIQNAIVHGGDTITLFAKGQQIGVADNGPGVEETQFAEILKPMVRLDTARETDGSGLGLALVRAVADRHGAQLDLGRHDPKGLRVALNFTDL